MDGWIIFFTNCNSVQSNLLNTLFSYHSATHISGSKKHIIPSIPIVISTRNSSSNKSIDDFHKSRNFLIFITLIFNTELMTENYWQQLLTIEIILFNSSNYYIKYDRLDLFPNNLNLTHQNLFVQKCFII